MKITTRFLGEVMIDEQSIIQFPEGIPAFEEETKFVLIPLKEGSPFIVLQSVETPSVGFMMTDPFNFKADYSFDLTEVEEKKLQADDSSDLLVFSILSLKDTIANSTMNLLAPVVINGQSQIGMQVVLHESDDRPLRYPLKAKEGSVD